MKYINLKEEILNYPFINITIYQNEIMPKAKIYFNTNIIKSIRCSGYGDYDKYGMEEGDIISLSKLICIILFSDFPKLNRDFCSTFHKNDAYETLQSVKKRNENYHFLSKELKEMVIAFGQTYNDGVGVLDSLRGPIFYATNSESYLSSFNVPLCSPFALTKQIEVAINDSLDHGIVVEFNNNKGYAQMVAAFDISFISRFGGQRDQRYYRLFLFSFFCVQS